MTLQQTIANKAGQVLHWAGDPDLKFINHKGDVVSTSVLDRWENREGLTEWEDGAFDFLDANPDFIDRVTDETRKIMDTGRKRYSINPILEVIRWGYDLEIQIVEGEDEPDPFKINVNFRPAIARIMNEALGEPFFTMREQAHEKPYTKQQIANMPICGRAQRIKDQIKAVMGKK